MNSLRQFLDEQKIEWREGGTHQHVRHGWIGLQCPWCRSAKWHLGVRLADGYTSCWRCGRKRLGDALALLTGLDWKRIWPVLSTIRGQLPERPEHKGSLKLPSGVCPLAPPHCKYLKTRGFNSKALARVWNIGGIGSGSRLAWRLFIPITMHGETVSWTTRAIGSRQPRYVSARPTEESFPHKNLLYGADLVLGHTVIVVEGPTDAWRFGPGAVATLGLQVTPVQVRELRSYPTVVICFDTSKEAEIRARTLANKLSEGEKFGPDIHVIQVQSADDPGGADYEEVCDLRRKFGLPVVGKP